MERKGTVGRQGRAEWMGSLRRMGLDGDRRQGKWRGDRIF